MLGRLAEIGRGIVPQKHYNIFDEFSTETIAIHREFQFVPQAFWKVLDQHFQSGVLEKPFESIQLSYSVG